MEVREVSGSGGKLEVYLNGEVRECWNVTECPGSAICAVGADWQVNPSQGMCMCMSWFGFTGGNCDEWSAQTAMILFLNTFAGTLAFVSLCAGISMLWRYVSSKIALSRLNSEQQAFAFANEPQTRPRGNNLAARLHLNPLVVTMILATIGALCMLAGTILSTIATVGFSTLYVVVIEPGTDRLQRRINQDLDNANVIMLALGYCFTACAAIILPLTWIDVTNRSIRLKHTNVLIVVVFSIFFTLVTIGVELPFYILSVQGYRSPSNRQWLKAVSLGWIVILGTLVFVNLVAFIKVTRFMKKLNVRSQVKQLFRRVQVAAFLMILALLATLILVGILPLVFEPRTFYSSPYVYVDSADNSRLGGRVCMSMLGLVCLWFVFLPVLSVERAVANAKERLASLHSSNRTPPSHRTHLPDDPSKSEHSSQAFKTFQGQQHSTQKGESWSHVDSQMSSSMGMTPSHHSNNGMTSSQRSRNGGAREKGLRSPKVVVVENLARSPQSPPSDVNSNQQGDVLEPT